MEDNAPADKKKREEERKEEREEEREEERDLVCNATTGLSIRSAHCWQCMVRHSACVRRTMPCQKCALLRHSVVL